VLFLNALYQFFIKWLAPNMALGTFWHPFSKVSLKNLSRRTLLKLGAKPPFRCQGAKLGATTISNHPCKKECNLNI
jgi:hypothetical protein